MVKAGLLKIMPNPLGADPGDRQKKPRKAGAIVVRFVTTNVILGTGAMITREHGNYGTLTPDPDFGL